MAGNEEDPRNLSMFLICLYTKTFNNYAPKEEKENLPESTGVYRIDRGCAGWIGTRLMLDPEFVLDCLEGVPVKRAADVFDYLDKAGERDAENGDGYNVAYHLKRFSKSCGVTIESVHYEREFALQKG